jgi:hypothetical protein
MRRARLTSESSPEEFLGWSPTIFAKRSKENKEGGKEKKKETEIER